MVVVENVGFYTGPLNSSEHVHTCCEILYLTKGRIRVSIEGKTYLPEENSIYIVSPMERHAITCLSSEYERYIIFMNPDNFEVDFTEKTLTRILKNRPAEFQHIIKLDNKEIQDIFQRCLEEYVNHRDCQYNNLRMVNLISEILILLYRQAPERFSFGDNNVRLSDIQKYIEENFERQLKISELANMFYINQYYLSHSFKAFTGYSPKQYLSRIRLIHARKLLVSTDLKVAEIAEKTGYETINDLSRQFKNQFHISPTEYRKKYPTTFYH